MNKFAILTAASALVLSLHCFVSGQASALAASPQKVSAASATGSQSHAQALYRASLPLLLNSAKLPEAMNYLNANLYAVGSYRATIMTLTLENTQKAALPAWESKFANDAVQRELTVLYEAGDSLHMLAEKSDRPALRAMLLRAEDCGYKLETAEGSFFPVIDYSSYRNFKSHVTGDIREYIAIMAVESNLPMSKDNGLVIAWTDVVSRALSQEAFIAAYPRSNRIAQIKTLYKQYETATFYGLNNTPLFHYDNLEMDLEAEKAYNAVLAKENGSSPYLEKLSAFMKLAKADDYKLTDEVEAYRKENIPLQ
ncbi:hypothetical protein KIH86_19665 [Paenibacillus sp. HN-1]|uniref:hypothetical protein n=1 Tax=Paenibacillus TaxID=44249 RepID=UPI001CA956DE|nr:MULTISPECIES: hypothetical protein [Paenibacillus]MBY9082194.1 hypothetical protein [Paenibacillus sp. CGMCC 1.18879]MBY9086428.1 hypothetical protein [Paenibacillus sinensis]